MVSGQTVVVTGGPTEKTHRARWWRVHDNGGASSTISFLCVSFMLFSSIGLLYTNMMYNGNNYESGSVGCQPDSEGSWAIGVFYGDSPFSLKPIEAMNVWENTSAAWPVANPIVTCGSVTGSGYPSNFVADPFLYLQGDVLYLFFETKNSITMQGDIGVARSMDNGASWEQMGVVLDEEWHLSYPYVFDYNGQIYMMPEGSKKGDLRLYRAVEFPLKWKLEKVILKRPLIDSFIVKYESRYWLFGSDHSRISTKKNGELEIWYSNTPFGPWKQHKKNPVYNTDKKTGARNGGRFAFVVLLIASIGLMFVGIGYIYGGSGGHESYAINHQYSQFTMLAMTYDARLWNLKWYIKHYSQCPSVREIVVVWNKGTPPDPTEFDSSVPVRIRVEEKNSLNNRFKIDPLIKTRAVLELDDDIIMSCDHIERGFKVWRENPDRLVGFYPRLVNGLGPLEYRGEKHARKFNRYNMILTGAAFMDNQAAFRRYWSEEAAAGRAVVDEFFNCEDVLMNFLYANATSSGTSVEYVKPAWTIDTSKFSRVAISENTQAHYRVRSKCLERFTTLYGGISSRMVEFRRRKDGWDQ
ncbi:putative hexosyltransferase [Helianthus annuus]|nr:putative hexosyltransferase [Helianthus annuus]